MKRQSILELREAERAHERKKVQASYARLYEIEFFQTHSLVYLKGRAADALTRMARRDEDFHSLTELGRKCRVQRERQEEVQAYLCRYADRMREYCAVTDEAVMFIRRRCVRAVRICDRWDETLHSLVDLGAKTTRLLANKVTCFAFLSHLAQGNMSYYRRREDAYNCLSAKSHRLFLAMAKQKVAQAWLGRIVAAIESNRQRRHDTFTELQSIGRKAVNHHIRTDVAFRALKVSCQLPVITYHTRISFLVWRYLCVACEV